MKYRIILSLIAFIIFSGCATTEVTSDFREDKTLVGTYSPPPEGFVKKRIAVIPFKDKTNQTHTTSDLGSISVDIATTLLVNTGRFEVVERERLDALLVEQKMEGIVDPETATKAGKILGVDLIFTGAITDFEIKETQSGTSIGIPSINDMPSLQLGKKTYTLSIFMAVDARIIRTDTAEILFAGTGEIKREEKAKSYRFGVDGYHIDTKGAVRIDQSAAGRQLRFAIDKIVRALVPKVDQTYNEPLPAPEPPPQPPDPPTERSDVLPLP
jgi:curli biogenesis system outer membrane secretion channel CsgG